MRHMRGVSYTYRIGKRIRHDIYIYSDGGEED